MNSGEVIQKKWRVGAELVLVLYGSGAGRESWFLFFFFSCRGCLLSRKFYFSLENLWFFDVNLCVCLVQSRKWVSLEPLFLFLFSFRLSSSSSVDIILEFKDRSLLFKTNDTCIQRKKSER